MLNILQVTVKCTMHHSEQPARLAMPMLVLLPLLLLCYGVGNVHCSKVHDSSIDLQALLDFKHGITIDPNGALNNWTMRSHFCHWNGVECTLEQPRRVRGLQLTSQRCQAKSAHLLATLLSLITLTSPIITLLVPYLFLAASNNCIFFFCTTTVCLE